MAYGVGQIDGFIVNDYIMLDGRGSVEKNGTRINFLAVNSAKELSGLAADGLLGLSPKLRQKKGSREAVDLLIKKMAETGKIKKALFSLYLTDL